MTLKPLRVWPGVVAAIVLVTARFGLKAVIPGFKGFRLGMMWALGASLAVLVWWTCFSRARWFERIGGVALIVAGLAAAWLVRHESMGPLWLVAYALQLACVALVIGAVLGRQLPAGPRRATIAAAILLACGVWTLFRMDGISGDHNALFAWRWAKSPEEKLLAVDAPKPQPRQPDVPDVVAPAVAPEPAKAKATPVAPARPIPTAIDWPGFRGVNRDGITRGIRIETDWSASPPVQLWRRPVGPGWSSFAVDGTRVYTQEQRGDDEVVTCYDATTGEPMWTHHDPARFFESNAGAGPRGTPTLHNGRVYTFGATGIVNALDARDGRLAWSRNAASDTGVTLPYWGFSSSPLVVDDRVIVAVSGRLIAYDLESGKQRWLAMSAGESYSSPHLVAIDGVRQVVLLGASGVTSVMPADGKRLWQHRWGGMPIVQPALTADGDLLISGSAESGTRRLAVARRADRWIVEPRWTSTALKPYFNDFVVHRGHAYGFDARILACIDIADGARKWKGGRYGNGQLLLLPEQDLLLVLSEEGELALVRATPDQFSEVARVPAIEGKTWNHPVLVRDTLLVRNAEEMAAFRLSLAKR